MNGDRIEGSVRRAYLLAGRASRLPGKFQLPIDGIPVVERLAQRLSRAGLEVVLVSVFPLEVRGTRTLSDPFDAGPLGGLEVARRDADGPFFLFGADMPFVDPRAVDALRDAFDGRSVVPVDASGAWAVLHAIYADLELPRILRLRRGGAGLRDLVRELDAAGRVRFLSGGEVPEASLVDIDTPADYRRALGRGGARADK